MRVVASVSCLSGSCLCRVPVSVVGSSVVGGIVHVSGSVVTDWSVCTSGCGPTEIVTVVGLETTVVSVRVRSDGSGSMRAVVRLTAVASRVPC